MIAGSIKRRKKSMEKIKTNGKGIYLEIKNMTKTFGDLVALNNVSLDVKEGEFVCLLGPSGCGKTTLLRIIAGLEQHNRGEIIQAGKNISRLPPRQRDFGIVFQSYALFPNLTAFRNIAYGLENRKVSKDEITERVNELLKLVGLPDVGHKYPSQLSGGQQQRIALARALATSPGLLLLDEPLSALDARVRISLRLEIKQLQQRLGITTVFVTHDQEEALVMADRIVVMNLGSIEQVGAPEEIYRRPASPFVADFVGAMNFLAGVAGEDERTVKCGTLPLVCAEPHHLASGEAVTVAVRPEDVRISDTSNGGINNSKTKVIMAEFLGAFYRLTLQLDQQEDRHLIAEVSNNRMRDMKIDLGSSIYAHLPPDLLRVYPGSVGMKS
jgi:iron(III) transport system ATP-binding protein